MKITKTQLKQIIKEELDTVIAQEGMTDPIPPQVLNSPDPSVRALGTEIHYTSAGNVAARAGDRNVWMTARLMWETDYNPEEHEKGGKGNATEGVYDHAIDSKIIEKSLRFDFDSVLVLNPTQPNPNHRAQWAGETARGPKGGRVVHPVFTLIEPSDGDRVVFFSLGYKDNATYMAREKS